MTVVVDAKLDKKKKIRLARERFIRARKAESSYAKQLRQVAKEVGEIVKRLAPKGIVANMDVLNKALSEYARNLRPWAQKVAARLVAEVGRRDATAWNELGDEIGRGLKQEIKTTPIGPAFKQLMSEQIDLITSLPLQASQRVHKLVIEGISDSRRASEVAREIMRTGHVTKSRANTIARTETTRAATAMVEARATHIGSESYIWRTAEDSDVRPAHRKLNGKVFRWDNPPVAGENGERAHPGAIYNCRCYPEPIIPDE